MYKPCLTANNDNGINSTSNDSNFSSFYVTSEITSLKTLEEKSLNRFFSAFQANEKVNISIGFLSFFRQSRNKQIHIIL